MKLICRWSRRVLITGYIQIHTFVG